MRKLFYKCLGKVNRRTEPELRQYHLKWREVDGYERLRKKPVVVCDGRQRDDKEK